MELNFFSYIPFTPVLVTRIDNFPVFLGLQLNHGSKNMEAEKERRCGSRESDFSVVLCFINTQWVNIQPSGLFGLVCGFQETLGCLI